MHNHEINSENKKKTFFVIVITVLTMILEIFYGFFTNSMALLADGFHMGTHAFALGLTFTAYMLIEKFDNSDIFTNGTEKIGTLAAYTSAIFLGITGIFIIAEALERFINPLAINFNDAIIVAIIGLLINSVCVFIMSEHKHNDEKCEDYNFKAAYLHILADALTSVFAIFALISGKIFNITFLDAFAGIFGGILIIKWSYGLLKNTVKILIDMKKPD